MVRAHARSPSPEVPIAGAVPLLLTAIGAALLPEWCYEMFGLAAAGTFATYAFIWKYLPDDLLKKRSLVEKKTVKGKEHKFVKVQHDNSEEHGVNHHCAFNPYDAKCHCACTQGAPYKPLVSLP
mgnify:CR=1 FL=1